MDQYPTVLASVQTEKKRMGPAQGTQSLNIKRETATVGMEGKRCDSVTGRRKLLGIQTNNCWLPPGQPLNYLATKRFV